MKKILCVVSLLILAINLFAVEEVIKEPKQRCTPEEFVIQPYGWDFTLDLDKHLALVYDCGFNVSTLVEPDCVGVVKKNKLKAIVHSGSNIDNNIADLNQRASDMTKKLADKIGADNLSSVYQISVKDEPFMKDMDYITAMSNAVINDLNVQPYVNLVPNYCDESIIGTNYEDYCTQVVKNCNLDYISYDNYSLFVNRGLNEDRFYNNLEVVRKICSENNVKLVNCILGVGHFNFSEPDDYSINIQGWSTLAYGGKGLTYFTFNTPDRGNYRGGALDIYGQKTPTYEIIKRLNLNIHHIMPYYKDLEWVNTFHMGNVPKGAKDYKSAQVVSEIACIYGTDGIYEGTPNYLVGEFKSKKDGKTYIIIVNKEEKLSIYCNWLIFRDGGEAYHIADMSLLGDIKKWDNEDRWIAPGHGMLIQSSK